MDDPSAKCRYPGTGTSFLEIERRAKKGCVWCDLCASALHVHCSWGRFMLNSRDGQLSSWDGQRIQIYTNDGYLASRFSPKLRTLPPLPYSTGSDDTIATICGWFQTCLSQHARCGTTTERGGFNPPRLLDIGKVLGDTVRLIDAGLSHNGTLHYACLSHCWGGAEPDCMTTKETLARNMTAIPWSTIPPTFEQAISLARRLGIHYLWIDSMCVIQRDTKDWAYQSPLMYEIFRHATVTIAATKAMNSSEGLFASHPNAYCAKQICSDPVVWARRVMPHIDDENNTNFPLLGRAWAFQELFFSPRVIHFGMGEVTLECKTRVWCQCEHINRPRTTFMDSSRKPDSETLFSNYEWLQLVERYSKLKLSRPHDKLPALSGAARRTTMFRGNDTYVAGLWQSNLATGLTWITHDALKTERKPWRAPSWSWACVDAPVFFHNDWNERAVAEVSVIENVVATSDVTGMVSSCTIALKAPMLKAKLPLPRQRGEYYATLGIKAGITYLRFWADYVLEEGERYRVTPGSALTCALLTRDGYFHTILILVKHGKRARYRRIGLATSILSEHDLSAFVEQTVILI